MTAAAEETAALERPRGLAVGKALLGRIKDHNVTVTAAGIAFFGLLALVPTLIATVSIYGLVNRGSEDDIKQQIEDAAGSLDESTKDFVQGQLTSITTSDGNLTALILGIVLALFSASGAVQKLMSTVSAAYETREARAGWKLRLLAYGFTLGAIIGMVVMVTAIAIVPAVLDTIELGGLAEAAIQFLQLPVLGLLFIGGLTVLYRYGPDRRQRTPWLNPGAWLAAGLWILFAVLFSLYSSNIGAMPASYGLLGTVAALMIFLQLTAFAVIIGAEYNAIVEGAGAQQPDTASAPERQTTQPLSFGRAVAGLAALFVLGRGGGS